MTTWTSETKNSTSYTNESRSVSGGAGCPIGLLLVLTYAATITTSWTEESKNTTIYTNETKS